MNNREETALFKDFIKELIASEITDFIENLEHSEGTNLTDYCSYTSPEDYVCRAFDWDESGFGYEHWETIDTDWTRHLHDFKSGLIAGPGGPKCKSIW